MKSDHVDDESVDGRSIERTILHTLSMRLKAKLGVPKMGWSSEVSKPRRHWLWHSASSENGSYILASVALVEDQQQDQAGSHSQLQGAERLLHHDCCPRSRIEILAAGGA
eukprot:764443-Hanusia_phi.AAC.7